uniref:F5/8 type C domain-containing protein n=1 Tax=Grammatophora oceanica TaxID=210454 RepID=A0A7S1UQU5_9STRA|mmetsp:Transcript_17537/g.25984  ORF Transcript_17537/g.25984 Transcript_17537/m.25984 type:complete len:189 (+) Transcript_17537:144-710(+)
MEKSEKQPAVVLLSAPEVGGIASVRCSSILNKNGKLYGPKNCLTEDETTCWNTDAAKGGGGGDEDEPSQWLQIEFDPSVVQHVTSLGFQWQAGFIPESCKLYYRRVDDAISWIEAADDGESWEMEDDHAMQTFDVERLLPTTDQAITVQAIRLVFTDFTDFYGRITLYRLQVWGLCVKEGDHHQAKGS